MKKDWELTPEKFERLLNWLDPDRGKAGETYEKIQQRLIKIFASHGCSDPEGLADKTIDRVSSKIDWLIEDYIGDPILYFCGVARNIIKEDLRDRVRIVDLPNQSEFKEADNEELEYECFERCLGQLGPNNRLLVLGYYKEKGGAKITHRRKQSEDLGITLRALRLRVFHLRLQLRACIEICLERPLLN